MRADRVDAQGLPGVGKMHVRERAAFEVEVPERWRQRRADQVFEAGDVVRIVRLRERQFEIATVVRVGSDEAVVQAIDHVGVCHIDPAG